MISIQELHNQCVAGIDNGRVTYVKDTSAEPSKMKEGDHVIIKSWMSGKIINEIDAGTFIRMEGLDMICSSGRYLEGRI